MKIRLLFLLVAVLCGRLALPAAEKSHDQKLDEYLTRCEEYTARVIPVSEKRIKALADQLKQLERSRVAKVDNGKGMVFASKTERDEAIRKQKKLVADEKAELARLKDGGLLNKPIEFPLIVGEIGAWGAPFLKVRQVVSETEAIIDRGDELFLLRGPSTKEMADDKPAVCLWPVLEVSGTYKYRTVLGAAKTIVVVEPFRLERDDKRRPVVD